MQSRVREKAHKVEQKGAFQDAITDPPMTPTVHWQRLRLERRPRLWL
jgi:hypothetical protein